MPGPQAFPQEGAYFTVPGRTSAAPTAWHRKASQVLGLNLPAAGAMHPRRDEYHPLQNNKPPT